MRMGGLSRRPIEDEDDQQEAYDARKTFAHSLAGHFHFPSHGLDAVLEFGAIPSEFYLEHLDNCNLVEGGGAAHPSCLDHTFRCNLCGKRLAKLATFATLIVLFVSPNVCAQPAQSSVTITISGLDVRIQVKASAESASWTFVDSYGAAIGLGNRISNVQGIDGTGRLQPARRLAVGAYQFGLPVASISYKIHLDGVRTAHAAQVSWLTSNCGLLMLEDLLPHEMKRPDSSMMDVRFELPSGWSIQSSVVRGDMGNYSLRDPAKAVFLVGTTLKSSSTTVKGTKLHLVSAGSWPFKESKTIKVAAKVLQEYRELTRFQLAEHPVIFVAPMPPTEKKEQWLANTKGSAVVLLLDPSAKFRNWIGQLEVIFTHELLHLWIPNSLKLTGDYDWFFEGFTLYQALVTAVDLKVISFDEYLNTLARVYDSYRSKPDRLSLMEASEQRWTGTTSAVYDKGMLVAFLYDLLLRSESGGKSKLADRYADLFRKYASKTVDANEAIMSLLGFSTATADVLKSYVQEHRPIDLNETLKRYGFVLQSSGGLTELNIANNPTTDQLRLLRSLGYRR